MIEGVGEVSPPEDPGRLAVSTRSHPWGVLSHLRVRTEVPRDKIDAEARPEVSNGVEIWKMAGAVGSSPRSHLSGVWDPELCF